MEFESIVKLNDEFGIKLPNYTLGNYKRTCPQCSHTRRKKDEQCLSVTIEVDHVKFNCHHCEFNGGFKTTKNVSYIHNKNNINKKVIDLNNTTLSTKHYEYLIGRGISKEVISKFKLYTQNNNLCFPYIYNGATVNVKSRSDDKRFYQQKNALKTLYNIDQIDSKNTNSIIFVEGEIDVLSVYTAGFTNVVSLPDGAPEQAKLNEDDKRFTAFLEHEHIFDIKEVIIATDNDKAGKALQTELAHRFGYEVCKTVEFPVFEGKQCKDANEVLTKCGVDVLKNCIQNAKEFPILGLHGANDYRDLVQNIYDGNVQKAYSTGFDNLDQIYKVMPSTFNLITGIPNHGKSNFLDQILINLAEKYDWRFAIFSPEHSTPNHIRRLVEKRCRKPFDIGFFQRMTQIELNGGIDFLDRHFRFIECDDDVPTIDYILEKARIAKLRYGIKGLVIDPFNQINSKREVQKREDEHIRDVIAVCQQFARNHQVVVWMVAHPHKLHRNDSGIIPPPDLYQVSGSAHWANMADVGMVIHRDFDNNTTRVITRKIREQGVYGNIGDAYFKFNLEKRVYEECNEN